MDWGSQTTPNPHPTRGERSGGIVCYQCITCVILECYLCLMVCYQCLTYAIWQAFFSMQTNTETLGEMFRPHTNSPDLYHTFFIVQSSSWGSSLSITLRFPLPISQVFVHTLQYPLPILFSPYLILSLAHSLSIHIPWTSLPSCLIILLPVCKASSCLYLTMKLSMPIPCATLP